MDVRASFLRFALSSGFVFTALCINWVWMYEHIGIGGTCIFGGVFFGMATMISRAFFGQAF